MTVACPNCLTPLPSWMLSEGVAANYCPRCYRETEVRTFPALFRRATAIDAGAQVVVEGESHCYEHRSKKAASICSQCGRFVCVLCEVELQGEVWCPECIEGGKKRQKIATLENRRTLHDSIALAAAAVPLLLFWLSCLTWPLPIYVAIRYWKTPGSLIPRNKWRFVAALSISLVEMAGLALIVFSVVMAQRRSRP